MNEKIENDMEALTEEVKRLRADFTKITDLLRPCLRSLTRADPDPAAS